MSGSSSTPQFECGSVVWVKLGQTWWPGTVTTPSKLPQEYVQDFRKMPIAFVKFFNENEYQDVKKPEHIYPYGFERRDEFVRKGLGLAKKSSEPGLVEKFKQDVVTAEKLTGGNMKIFEDIESEIKRKVDYSELGFGLGLVKKKKDDPKKHGSDIKQIINYKKHLAGGKGPRKILQHTTKILEQPHREMTAEEQAEATRFFKCYKCSFTCSRLGVIVWHNKNHMKLVCDYDSGIRIPGKRRRKPGANRNKKKPQKESKKKQKEKEVVNTNHLQVNGIDNTPSSSSQENLQTQELLNDWNDEDDLVEHEDAVEADSSLCHENGHQDSHNSDCENDDNDAYSNDDNDYPPPEPRQYRQPMPKAAEVSMAFDALLADTPSTHSTPINQVNNFTNNDSDSDCSDWEKYYARDSESDKDDDIKEEESDIKSICEEACYSQTNGKSHNSNDNQIADVMEDHQTSDNGTEIDSQVVMIPDADTDSYVVDVQEIATANEVEVVDMANERYVSEELQDDSASFQDPVLTEAKEIIKSTQPVSTYEEFSGSSSSKLAYVDTEADNEAVVTEPLIIERIETVQDDIELEEEHPLQTISDSESESESDSDSIQEIPEEDKHSTLEAVDLSIASKAYNAPDSPQTCESTSSNESTSSSSDGTGPAYMLVAVDAHGNNVPMPALSEGGSHLVAVEASMDDGTTRTLYIDPSHLGPNVDLNNLMLHIDHSGQETVIIPSTVSDQGPATTTTTTTSVSSVGDADDTVSSTSTVKTTSVERSGDSDCDSL